MFKRMTLLRRRADQTAAAFQAHWSQVHARLVLGLPAIRRYVQNDIGRAWPPMQFNGIVELWFDDEAALRAAFASDAGRALLPDEARFLGGKIVCDVEERIVARRAPTDGAAKLVSVVHSRLAGDESAWARWHARLASAPPTVEGLIALSHHRIATQKGSGCEADARPDVFGFLVYHFDTVDARDAFARSRDAEAVERIDADPAAHAVRIAVTERVLLDPDRPSTAA
jgi:uncharacterized protein (TIGR02118 family)